MTAGWMTFCSEWSASSRPDTYLVDHDTQVSLGIYFSES